MAFERLLRFELDGAILYGDLVEAKEGSCFVRKLHGSIAEGFFLAHQKRLLAFQQTNTKFTMHWIELQEACKRGFMTFQLDIPDYPVVFTKTADALAGPNQAIPICSDAQTMLDYEGELAVVVGKDCKNLPDNFELADYVLGYTAGNDVSARNFQLPAVSGSQFCYAKSFDSFAPIGPWITSPRLIPDPHALRYTTGVNGVIVQETSTDDMIWSVKKILKHLSRGTTLRAGTVILAGTPSGVGFFRKKFLQNGDVVEVEIEGEMKLVNTITFE